MAQPSSSAARPAPARWLAVLAACLAFAVAPAQADDIQKIDQQYRAGDAAGALARIESHLSKQPRDAQARFLKGVILSEQGKSSDAIQLFTGLTEDYPELPEPYNNLAVLYAAQSQYDDARRALEGAIRAQPGYATAHENLGDLHAKTAAIAYAKALALDSKNAAVQTKLTRIQNLLGQPVPAR